VNPVSVMCGASGRLASPASFAQQSRRRPNGPVRWNAGVRPPHAKLRYLADQVVLVLTRGQPIDEALADHPRSPALGIQTIVQLQRAVEPGRAVLEVAPAVGDAQPSVLHVGRPEAFDPQQPVLLPDRDGTSHDHAEPSVEETDTLKRVVNKHPVLRGESGGPFVLSQC